MIDQIRSVERCLRTMAGEVQKIQSVEKSLAMLVKGVNQLLRNLKLKRTVIDHSFSLEKFFEREIVSAHESS